MPLADCQLITDVLEEYSAITRTWMGRYLEGGEPKTYLYDLASNYPMRGGRGMRPSLCLASTRAVGGDEQQAVLTAVALELMHNATLVHDDIEDASELRRGQPTLHAMHGVPLAINAGDLLMTLAAQPLLDNVERIGPELSLRVFTEFHTAARETAEGQALELGWRQENEVDLTPCDYHAMVFKKTSWLSVVHPMRLGVLIGNRGRRPLDEFVRLGFFLGSAFQIQDDVLNLLGDESAYGKENCGDIAEGKRSLMLIHLLGELNGADRQKLKEILGLSRDERSAQVPWVQAQMRACGSIDYARRVLHAHAGAAMHEFERAFGSLPDTREKRFIKNLIYWVIERS